MAARLLFEESLPDGKTAQLFGDDVGDNEIWIDGAWGLTVVGGICKINLYTIAPEANSEFERREVCARLTMSPILMVQLRDLLSGNIKLLEERGIITIGDSGENSPEQEEC